MRRRGYVFRFDRLRQLMDKMGDTPKQLATYLDRHKSTVGKVLSGKRAPSLELVVEFADAYDTTTDYLLGRTAVP